MPKLIISTTLLYVHQYTVAQDIAVVYMKNLKSLCDTI